MSSDSRSKSQLEEELASALERIAKLEARVGGVPEPASADTSLGPDSNVPLRTLVENSPDVIMLLDLERRIQFINYTLPEYTVDQVTGSNVLDFILENERETYAATFDRVVATAESGSLELEGAGPTWWLTRLIPVRRDQTVEAVLAIATEATESKRAERALRESENKFRALAETTTAAIFIFQDDKMLYANPAAAGITGYSHEEILKLHFWDVIHSDFREEAKKRGLMRQAGDDVPTRYEVKLRTKDNQVKWVDYAGSMLDFGGKPAVLGTAVDITERKKAEQERRELEAKILHAQKLESLGVLAGGIAHDFNNLLTGILGSASLAAMKLPENSPASEQLARILQAAEKAADLTNQMLAYAGKARLVIGPLDLNALVQEVMPLVSTSLAKKTELRHKFAENLPSIEGDKTQLQQVVMNLITNAAEALEDGEGVVTVRTGAMSNRAPGAPDDDNGAGSNVFVEVSDTGAGMDPSTREKIFDPFFTTKFTGRGLGLAAVQGIVHAHRGTIRVQSRPDRGTTFTVLFPASRRAASVLLGEPTSSDPKRSSGTILVIDDEESVRNVARASLEDSGFVVVTASDGTRALDIFQGREEEIDAVLLDMSMPRMSGEETLDELRRIRPTVPVVLTSGYSELEVSQRFAGKGLAGFVQKPFRASELVRKVQKALEL